MRDTLFNSIMMKPIEQLPLSRARVANPVGMTTDLLVGAGRSILVALIIGYHLKLDQALTLLN